MARRTLAFVVCVAFTSLAPAAFAPRKDLPGQMRTFPNKLVKEATASQQAELVITEATEIKLDGRGCKYEDVPQGADIVLLEVAGDKKSILKIHFQTKK